MQYDNTKTNNALELVTNNALELATNNALELGTNNTPKLEANNMPELLKNLVVLMGAHQSAFGQARCYRRAMALVFAEMFAFARHTVTQCLLTLGMSGVDWSAWYRLFSQERFDEKVLTKQLFQETLQSSPQAEPYVTGIDGTQIARSSQKMPGTSWLPAPRTAVFRKGIHRAQRFVQGAWLTPKEQGYSRAIPLRFLPAFPPKACEADVPAHKEWEAGLEFVKDIRDHLDEAGRKTQQLLVLADGAYDNVALWRALPERTTLLVRTAKNRRLRHMPVKEEGKRLLKYGPVARHPQEWLTERTGWSRTTIPVRGRSIPMRYRVEGPFLRETAPQVPLFLIVVSGAEWQRGKRKKRRARRDPAFYLVNAVERDGQWVLPLPIKELLEWIWQRWELEVTHREMKCSFGVGQKQCWQKRSAVVSVQWSVWVYAVLVLAGYRTWGLFNHPKRTERWWPGAQRWSFNTLLRAYRSALWDIPDFRAVWTPIGDNWPKKEAFLVALTNAALGAQRG